MPPVKFIKPIDASKAGISGWGSKMYVNSNRLYVDITYDGHPERAYLARELQEKEYTPLPTMPVALPTSFIFMEVTSPTGKYIIVGKDQNENKRSRKPYAGDTQFPFRITDQIHIYSKTGAFKVLYVSRDVIVLTNQQMCDDYLKGYINNPSFYTDWSDFQSKHVIQGQ